MAGERLLEAIQSAADGQYNRKTPTDFIFGTVTSLNPLVIKPDNNKPITQDFLILSALCRRFDTGNLVHLHLAERGSGEETDDRLVTVMVWRGLIVGDRVRMLQCCGGQKYYVLDREEPL